MMKGRKILILVFFVIVLAFLYRYSPRRIEFLGYYDKVFAHRVNSIEKLNAALYYFNGVELDLVYNETDNRLDVNHPPAETIGLNFETYLSKIKYNNFPFLWLDIKALDTTNAHAILLKLNTLFEIRNYPKQQVLIETLQPEALPIFTNAGYKTSYYLPSSLSENRPEVIKEIKDVLAKQPKIGISTSYENFSIISHAFPERTKYLWAISSPYRTKYRIVRTILKDKTVSIVLSKFQSLSGNR